MTPRTSPARIATLGFGALALAMGVGRFAFTPLLPMMRDDGILTLADGGVVASVHFLGYLMGAMLAARVPASPRSTLRFSLLAIALATTAMGATQDVLAWSLLRWVCGVCSAWTLVIVSNYCIRHLAAHGSGAQHGAVFSGVGGGIALVGLACLAFMAGQAASATTWQLLGAVSLLAACALCLQVGPELPAARVAARSSGGERSPLVWTMIVAYGTAGLGYIVPATYLPLMARELVASPLVFGWSWPVFGAAAFASTLLAVRLERRMSNRRIWLWSQLAMAAGVLLPALFEHIAAVILSGVLVGGTFMIITMVGMKEAHRVAPRDDVMRHIAAMTTAFASGQMIGPVLGSALHDVTGSFGLTLCLTGAALLVTASALIHAPRAQKACAS
jgi:predicted MFS family arabinose efflux permease